MKIVRIEDLDVGEVVEILNRGGLIVYPTETVYGLGVDATNDTALERLWRFKGERGDKPVLVAVSGLAMANEYAEISVLGKKVAQKYWPGPVAIVALSNNLVAKKAQGLTETLGLRNPDNKKILKLIAGLEKPITSTSANISGNETARSLKEFEARVPEKNRELVDLFIDAGELALRQPSTIVDTTGARIKILRQGDISVEV